MRTNYLYMTVVLLSAMLSFSSCNEELEDIHANRIFIDGYEKMYYAPLKNNFIETERTVSAAIAKPIGQDIEIVYKIEPSLVKTFQTTFYEPEAIMLDAAHYELLSVNDKIVAGSVHSAGTTIKFKDMNILDRSQIYVLPVTIAEASNIEMLPRDLTFYYMFKQGALIDVVANLKENNLPVLWSADSAPVSNLTTLTMEALIRIHKYEKLNTVMGIEGKFLIRIGDTDRDWSQLQIATSGGNFPGPDSKKNLPKDEWVHIAFVYDAAAGNYTIYINGEIQSDVQDGSGITLGSVDLSSGFHIGKSYDDLRWMDGEASEFRIWNTLRSQKEIKDNVYGVDPTTEGLVAYWKFDEGEGSNVKDYSIYENHLTSVNPIKWIPVVLPAPAK